MGREVKFTLFLHKKKRLGGKKLQKVKLGENSHFIAGEKISGAGEILARLGRGKDPGDRGGGIAVRVSFN